MSRKIIGVTVGTTLSPQMIKEKLQPVTTVNGQAPDENGNVVVTFTDESGNIDLSGYATEEWVQDGYQPKGDYLTEHQDISGKLDTDKLPEAINTALAQAKASGEFDGYAPVKGVDYFDGKDGDDGEDGISTTHSWNGTVLTVTSASGTSSADLKGRDGYDPVRGTDYWTAEDIAQIKSYVDEAILGGAW